MPNDKRDTPPTPRTGAPAEPEPPKEQRRPKNEPGAIHRPEDLKYGITEEDIHLGEK